MGFLRSQAYLGATALVEHPDGRQQRFRFTHCLDDYDRLVGLLRSFPGSCRIAFEPTADFHRTLGFRLVREGFEVCLVSSVASARLREAIFNSWDKNDPKDAEVILRLLKQGMTQRYHDPLIHEIHDLQELSKAWYQQGINPQSHLPYLATYLGHSEISSTLVYLTVTPELLQLASERFRNHSAHIVRIAEALS